MIALVALFSCEKSVEKEASIRFVNAAVSNGNIMTKVSNQDIFYEFYTGIINGSLSADNYYLTLTEVDGDAKYEFYGSWHSFDFVTIKTGTYLVQGVSTADGEYFQDKCSFVFNETVEISAYDNTVTLNGDYDCYLIIFDENEINDVINFNGKENVEFFSYSHYKYAFVNDKPYKENVKDYANINGRTKTNARFKINTGNFPFAKGMHYVFSSVISSFYVPEMGDGWGDETTEEDNQEENNDVNENYATNVSGTVSNPIDLGLSVQWAEWNLGANAEYEYGGLYGIGDPSGTNHSHNGYFFNGESICGTKYDLAHAAWGDNWRLPTRAELDELVSNCIWEEFYINDIKGIKVTANNGNSIFFPYAGDRDYEDYYRVGEEVHIWAGDVYDNIHYKGYYDIDAKTGKVTQNDGCPFYIGQTIRPVKKYN